MIDDDAVLRIVASCRTVEPSATEDEIAHFTHSKIQQHRRNPAVKNLPGLLIGAVAEYFRAPATELAAYRAARDEERRRSRELAQQILDDPASDERELEWARETLRG